jgi:predicted molibdopterin-dependent oxidoreductase YjgC
MSPVKSRVWQSERIDTTCPHCGFGCRLTQNVCEGRLINKVVSEGGLPPNFASLCVRGRFGYDFIAHPARLTGASVSFDGTKKAVGWEDAVKTAAERLRRLDEEGKGLGFIASARITNEELYLLSRIAGLFKNARVATPAFYHTGKAAAAMAKAGIALDGGQEKLSDCDLILVAGADLLINNHLLANKVRRAVLTNGARVIVIDPLPASLARIADAHLQPMPGQDALVFDALSRRLLKAGAYDKETEQLEGFAGFKAARLSNDAASPAPASVDPAHFEKAGCMIEAASRIAVLFGSGITDREASLTALLNLALLKGLPGRGVVIATALQSNARGALAILGIADSPEEVILSSDTAGILFYEEDPFHFMNEKKVREALAAKSFVGVSDILPTRVMDFAHLTVPSTSFGEKEGTVISGDGTLREVRKAIQGGPGGLEFLKDLLGCLGGKRYGYRDELDSDLKKDFPVMCQAALGQAREGSAGKGRFTVGPVSAAPAGAATWPYRLILRDRFASHHLADKEIYAAGIARVQKEMLYISPDDAAALGLIEGDLIRLESDEGAAVRPVTIKKGIRAGVLECLLFEKRGELLALSAKPAKVIDVSAGKA